MPGRIRQNKWSLAQEIAKRHGIPHEGVRNITFESNIGIIRSKRGPRYERDPDHPLKSRRIKELQRVAVRVTPQRIFVQVGSKSHGIPWRGAKVMRLMGGGPMYMLMTRNYELPIKRITDINSPRRRKSKKKRKQ